MTFRKRKFATICSSKNEMIRKFGSRMARVLARRLTELEAAVNLADLGTLPQARAHELKGDRHGQISLDLVHPYRLILEVANRPVPAKPDGGLDWDRVESVRVLDILDTHE